MRSDFFLDELEQFLLLSRENGFDPLAPRGSYAGAMGIPQFMPSSWRSFAVDFDGDGVIDLDNSLADSIGSVANYLEKHGWQKGEPVAHRATLANATGVPSPAWWAAGMLPSLSVKKLKASGVTTEHENTPKTATFVHLPTVGGPTEYWLGYQNYYAITRYNRSHEYSMSVFLLAEGIKAETLKPEWIKARATKARAMRAEAMKAKGSGDSQPSHGRPQVRPSVRGLAVHLYVADAWKNAPFAVPLT
jgi:membrane-bound lytic murein transglycosylase B